MPWAGDLGDDPETGPIRPVLPDVETTTRPGEGLSYQQVKNLANGRAKRGTAKPPPVKAKPSYPRQDHKTVTLVCSASIAAQLESYERTSSKLWDLLVEHNAQYHVTNGLHLNWSELQKLLPVWKKDCSELRELPWEVGQSVVRQVRDAFMQFTRSERVAVRAPPIAGLYFAYPQIRKKMIRLSKLGWIEFDTSISVRAVLEGSIRIKGATVSRRKDQDAWQANISFDRQDVKIIAGEVALARHAEVNQATLTDAVLWCATREGICPWWQVAISTADLITELSGRGISLHPKQLAGVMRGIGIKPHQQQIGGKYIWGYDRRAILAAREIREEDG